MDLRSQNYISLAAGVGGLDLGVHMALQTARLVCAVEIEAYACEVLASRMEEGRLDPAPVWTDLRTFDGRPWRGLVDGIVAGYPCQPWSLAGKRRGVEDPRHLWPHVARVIREIGPSWVFCENVAGHLSLGAHDVTRELQEMGYDVAANLFTAEEVGASHKRERIFILGLGDATSFTERESRDEGLRADGGRKPVRAGGDVGHANGAGREGWGLRERERANERLAWPTGCSLANTNNNRREGERSGGVFNEEWTTQRDNTDGSRGAGHLRVVPFPPPPADADGWRWYLDTFGEELAPALTRAELILRRGADGMACRLDELRACGNGVVPLQAAYAFVSLLRDLIAFRSARSGSGTTGAGVAPELE